MLGSAVVVVRESFGAWLCKEASLIKYLEVSVSAFFSTSPAQGITSTLVSKGDVTIGSYDAHKVFMKMSGLIKEEHVRDIIARNGDT